MMDQSSTIALEETSIIEEFELFDGPREVIEHIVELGKDLPGIADELKTEGNLVRGCQSQVWIVAGLDAGRLTLSADSDAIVVKGLIALVLRLYSNRRPAEIIESDVSVFKEIGLGSMLTPGRQNGLYAMLARIQQLAQAYASVTENASAKGNLAPP